MRYDQRRARFGTAYCDRPRRLPGSGFTMAVGWGCAPCGPVSSLGLLAESHGTHSRSGAVDLTDAVRLLAGMDQALVAGRMVELGRAANQAAEILRRTGWAMIDRMERYSAEFDWRVDYGDGEPVELGDHVDEGTPSWLDAGPQRPLLDRIDELIG